MTEAAADIALIGLARLGQNLALSLADHGYKVVAYNRTAEKLSEFLRGAAKDRPNIVGAHSLEEMVGLLARPRKVVLTIPAGPAPDELIEQLVPHLEPGDLIVDAGNSHFADTIRRVQYLENRGILFIGAGISACGEGASNGLSIMPGGSPEAWPLVRDMFQSIAARSPDGEPCCDWVGEGGAGHFVKMVHNGIEYVDMQLICEAYQLLSQGLGLTTQEMHRVFAEWNRGELESYLIAITADILAFEEDGVPVVETILDTAGQQGTGTWAVVTSLDLGVPATLVAEAVYARLLAAMKDERVGAAEVLSGPAGRFEGSRDAFVKELGEAMLATRTVSYAQAFMLMRTAAEAHGWTLNHGAIAGIWQGGGIIRSALLKDIRDGFARNPDLQSMILGGSFSALVDRCQTSWRRVVTTAVELGIPVPVTSGSLAFYDGYRTARLPANLLQAQRDYFAAHTYERVDRERGLRFHTDWTDGSTTQGR